MAILVTGGAGFIGSNFVRMLHGQGSERLVVLDALTYAGNLENLAGCLDDDRCRFVHGSITDAACVREVISAHGVDTIINMAAESHVDRSIQSAVPFVDTNVKGTTVLLEAARDLGIRWFVHVSTDEVYGSLEHDDAPFTELHPLKPSSPYAASKAAADLLVQAFVHTYGLHAVITRCSNNYGPYQFPEKFIPLFILNAMEGRALPIYGDGQQIRDWIHVDDHCRGILAALHHGSAGEVYNFGGASEETNLHVAHLIIEALGASTDLLEHVTDRLGHDRRYAIDSTKAERELGWAPTVRFNDGLPATIAWYQQHRSWSEHVRDGSYRDYYQQHYHKSF